MTRNDLIKVVKTMILSMACALPLVLIFSFAIAGKLPNFAVTILDAALLICAGVAGYFVQAAREKRIKRKRAEYLALQSQKNQKDQKDN